MAQKLKRVAERKVRSGRIIVWDDRHEMGVQSEGMQGGQQRERERRNPSQIHLGANLRAEQAQMPQLCAELVTRTPKTNLQYKGEKVNMFRVWPHSMRKCLGMEVTISLL